MASLLPLQNVHLPQSPLLVVPRKQDTEVHELSSANHQESPDINIESHLKPLGISFRHIGDRFTPFVTCENLENNYYLLSKNLSILNDTIEDLNRFKSVLDGVPIKKESPSIHEYPSSSVHLCLLTPLLPESCKPVHGKISEGINCFGTALGAYGLTKRYQHIKPEQLHFYLKHCFTRLPLGSTPQPGDMGVIADTASGFVHAFIYINDQIILEKESCTETSPIKLTGIGNPIDWYSVGIDPTVVVRFFRVNQNTPFIREVPKYSPLSKDREELLFETHLEGLDKYIEPFYNLFDSEEELHDSNIDPERSFFSLVEYFYLVLQDIEREKIQDPKKIEALFFRFSTVLYDHQAAVDGTKLFLRDVFSEEKKLSKSQIKKFSKQIQDIDAFDVFEKTRALYSALCKKHGISFWIDSNTPEEALKAKMQFDFLVSDS